MPPETPKLSDIAGAIQLLEHWFYLTTVEVKSGNLKKGLKNFIWKQKNHPKFTIFPKNYNIVSCFTVKNTYAAPYSETLFLIHRVAL